MIDRYKLKQDLQSTFGTIGYILLFFENGRMDLQTNLNNSKIVVKALKKAMLHIKRQPKSDY
jgi:hypothetical protein